MAVRTLTPFVNVTCALHVPDHIFEIQVALTLAALLIPGASLLVIVTTGYPFSHDLLHDKVPCILTEPEQSVVLFVGELIVMLPNDETPVIRPIAVTATKNKRGNVILLNGCFDVVLIVFCRNFIMTGTYGILSSMDDAPVQIVKWDFNY
jgi:hypothetical protein